MVLTSASTGDGLVRKRAGASKTLPDVIRSLETRRGLSYIYILGSQSLNSQSLKRTHYVSCLARKHQRLTPKEPKAFVLSLRDTEENCERIKNLAES